MIGGAETIFGAIFILIEFVQYITIDQNQSKFSNQFGCNSYSSTCEFVVYNVMQVQSMSKEVQIHYVCC
jgi:hypothetical protein